MARRRDDAEEEDRPRPGRKQKAGGMSKKPQAEFELLPERRRALWNFCIGFGVLGLVCLMIGLSRLQSPVLGDSTFALRIVVLFGSVLVVGCAATGVTLSQPNRVAFFRDYAELPYPIRPPWCLIPLPPFRLWYDEVRKWGAGEESTTDGLEAVLAFAVESEVGGSERVFRLRVSNFTDADGLQEEFEKRLPPACRVSVGGTFGGVTFRQKKRRRRPDRGG